jgi:outer membrane lipoprotein-sorting protein
MIKQDKLQQYWGWTVALCCMILLVSAGHTHAAQNEKEDKQEAQRWEQLAEAIEKSPAPKTIRASFAQIRTSLLLSEPVKSEGVFLSDGEVTRWSLGKPEGVEVRTDAKQMQIYYVADNVLEIYPIPEQGLPMPSHRPDLKRLKKGFVLSSFQEKEQQATIRLQARGEMSKHLKSIALRFDMSRGVMTSVTTVDPAGDTTQMTLQDVEIDKQIKADELTLDVPDDARVQRPTEKN